MKRQYIYIINFFFILILPVLAFAQNQNSSYQKQIAEYKAAINKYHKEGSLKEEAFYLNKLAYLYWDNQDFKESVEMFNNLLKVDEKLKDVSSIMVTYGNLGILYTDLGKYKQALSEFTKQLELQRKANNQPAIYDALTNVAMVSGYMGKPKESLFYMDEALTIAKSLNDVKRIQHCYLKLSEYYKSLGNVSKSMEYYNYFVAQQNKIQQDNLRNDARKNIKTLEDQKRRAELDVISKDLQLKNTEQELEYEKKVIEQAERKNREQQLKIQLLNQKQKIENMEFLHQTEELKKVRLIKNFILGAAIFIALIGFILLRDYRKIRNLNTQLIRQNIEILKQKQEIADQNTLLDLSQRSLLDAKVVIQEQNLKLHSYNRNLEKQVEERTHDLQKAYNELLLINNDLDTLTYRASHDLKSPVASLDGLCNVALMEITEENPASFYFTRIKEIAGNMATLLENLASLRDIKHTTLKPVEFGIRNLVENNIKNEIKSLPLSDKIDFMVSIDETIKVKTDIELYQLVLKNVVQNAVQFSLKPNANHKPYIKIIGKNEEKFVEIRIIDNGEGISKEVAPKIFNMFYRGTVTSKGVGLGLYTCKAAIEKLDGSIEYTETPEKETCFSIKLFKKVITAKVEEPILKTDSMGFSA